MSNNTLGAFKLSPVKEDGKFVFINMEIRMNNKLNKGDYIKIYVSGYEVQGGKHIISGGSTALSKMVVRGIPLKQEHDNEYASVEDLYDAVCGMYRNQFYFGKISI